MRLLLHPARSLVIALALFAAGSANALPLLNGSFEDGINLDGQIRLLDNSTDVTSWEVLFDSIDYVESGWQASDGVRSVDLVGNAPGGIGQFFTTVDQQRYVVSFDMAGDPSGTQNQKVMNVSVAGQVFQFFFDTTGRSTSDMGWERMSFEFTAVGTDTALLFRSGNQDGQGPALDNVSVSVVPEPSTNVLLGLGVAGLAAYRRRKTVRLGSARLQLRV